MPFITEELWHALHDGEPAAKSIALTRFPQGADFARNEAAEREFALLQELTGAVRELRKQAAVPEKEVLPISIFSATAEVADGVKANQDLLAKLARVAEVRLADAGLQGANVRHLAALDVGIEYERKIDVDFERDRLRKELERLNKEWDNSQRQLQNESFLAKAPAKVVDGLKTRAAELPGLLEKTRGALNALEG
jgi:valyl-tRNA synthetase